MLQGVGLLRRSDLMFPRDHTASCRTSPKHGLFHKRCYTPFTKVWNPRGVSSWQVVSGQAREPWEDPTRTFLYVHIYVCVYVYMCIYK